jgi:dTDP-4-dehydrorhamnose reductase
VATTSSPPPLELWGGIECTVNRVGDEWFDQLDWSGHRRRYDDLDRLCALGIGTLRYPVLWECIAANGLDDADWSWFDERLAGLRARGIRPIAGLVHHGSGPSGTSLLDPEFPRKLARFAHAMAARYPWVVDFTPVNEPLTTARFSGLYGHWYPHVRSDRAFVRALINQLRGIVLAMRAIRQVTPAARLIQTEDCGATFGTPATESQVRHEEHRRWLTWDFLHGRVTADHPLYEYLSTAGMTADDVEFFATADCRPDVIGLNYYVTSDRVLDDRLWLYPTAAHGGNGRIRYADVEAVRVRPQGIVGHHQHLLTAWRRYRRPVAITEVHLGCSTDEQMRWLAEAWHAAEAARADGADVRAVTAWALFGSFDWDSLVVHPRGHYEPGAFDVRGLAPRPTRLAAMIRSLANGRRPATPTLARTPWWHDPSRLCYLPLSEMCPHQEDTLNHR